MDSISEAERFRGQEIKLPEEDIPDREEDEYYLYQLTGCRVFDSKGEEIGVVREVQIIAGNELLVLETGYADILIPFAAEICREIDLKQRKIMIDPPEGLLDLNEIGYNHSFSRDVREPVFRRSDQKGLGYRGDRDPNS